MFWGFLKNFGPRHRSNLAVFWFDLVGVVSYGIIVTGLWMRKDCNFCGKKWQNHDFPRQNHGFCSFFLALTRHHVAERSLTDQIEFRSHNSKSMEILAWVNDLSGRVEFWRFLLWFKTSWVPTLGGGLFFKRLDLGFMGGLRCFDPLLFYLWGFVDFFCVH